MTPLDRGGLPTLPDLSRPPRSLAEGAGLAIRAVSPMAILGLHRRDPDGETEGERQDEAKTANWKEPRHGALV